MSPRALKLLAALSMLAALTGVVVIAGVTQLNAYLVRPGPAREETVVVLPRGAGLARIAALLNNAGVIEHPWMFRMAVRVLGRDRALKAGEYAFPAAITPASVLNLMASGQTVAHRLTVAEGLTVAEIYQLLDKADGLVGELPPAPPEGSLLPETYFYAFGDSRADLVKRMQRGMQNALAELWPQRARGLPIARREDAVTLASIVDKETGQADERRKVAAVFINRLRRGMRLQADPTVIYGLTEGGRLGRALTRNDWADGSAYNTYQIDGLPPGPIANPGRASIEAVLNPAPVDYLYFVANGKGGHAFARTLAEHNQNVAAWRRLEAGDALPEPPPRKPKPATAPAPKPETAPAPKPETASTSKPETDAAPKPEAASAPSRRPRRRRSQRPHRRPHPETASTSKPGPEAAPKPESASAPKPATASDPETAAAPAPETAPATKPAD